MYRYDYTTGRIDANPYFDQQFKASVAAEIPRYLTLWNHRFRPISVVNYKVRLLMGAVAQKLVD
jgi:hypothetical protein